MRQIYPTIIVPHYNYNNSHIHLLELAKRRIFEGKSRYVCIALTKALTDHYDYYSDIRLHPYTADDLQELIRRLLYPFEYLDQWYFNRNSVKPSVYFHGGFDRYLRVHWIENVLDPFLKRIINERLQCLEVPSPMLDWKVDNPNPPVRAKWINL